MYSFEKEGWSEVDSKYRDISGSVRKIKTCRGCVHMDMVEIKTVPMEYCNDYVYICRKLNDLILELEETSDDVKPSDKCPFTKQVIRDLKIESIIK